MTISLDLILSKKSKYLVALFALVGSLISFIPIVFQWANYSKAIVLFEGSYVIDKFSIIDKRFFNSLYIFSLIGPNPLNFLASSKLIMANLTSSGFFISLTSSIKADLNENLINQLEEGGKLIFIRHAYAPGGGDPKDFNLNDCSTQRNLSDRGKKQAEHIRSIFRENKI